MKTTTIYECDICHRQSGDRAEVEQCEAIGLIPAEAEIGDIISISQGYGGWHSDKMDWFHSEPGDPQSRNHLERKRIGYPKAIVMAKVPYGQLSSMGVGSSGHREMLIIYSPKWANGPSELWAWAPGFHAKHGRADEDQMREYALKMPPIGRINLL